MHMAGKLTRGTLGTNKRKLGPFLRIMDCLRVEGTSEIQLFQSLLKQGLLELVTQIHVRLLLSISNEGGFTTCLGNLY